MDEAQIRSACVVTERIIAVKPVPEYFSLTWMLGSRCNYDCMYCPRELHDATSVPHDFETMTSVWNNIYQKTKHHALPYKISFTGGEVTANKNFLPLTKWLRENYKDIAMILITTNGSASQSYYEKLSDYVDAISLSTHSEFMDEKKFFDIVFCINQKMIRPQKSLHVNVMDEHWNQQRIQLYVKWLEQHNISYSINRIDYSQAVRTDILNKGKQNFEF
jgi:MoaA/NifB/PqqE/SkfB family radical SAM enzyme